MIERYNLLQAIYDNNDEWSCQSPCPHTMEEAKPECMCYTCAEQKLKEYEDSIRRQTIDDFAKKLESNLLSDADREIMRFVAKQMKGDQNETW